MTVLGKNFGCSKMENMLNGKTLNATFHQKLILHNLKYYFGHACEFQADSNPIGMIFEIETLAYVYR